MPQRCAHYANPWYGDGMAATDVQQWTVDQIGCKLVDLGNEVHGLKTHIMGMSDQINERFDAVDERFDALEKLIRESMNGHGSA